jgi:hypothetical protein
VDEIQDAEVKTYYLIKINVLNVRFLRRLGLDTEADVPCSRADDLRVRAPFVGIYYCSLLTTSVVL